MSAALDSFRAVVDNRKGQVDTYIAARKADVDASSLSNPEKTQVKAMLDNIATNSKGLIEGLYTQFEDVGYVMVLKECARHLRKHVVAQTTPENQTVSDLVRDRIDNLTTEDDGAVLIFAKTLVG